MRVPHLFLYALLLLGLFTLSVYTDDCTLADYDAQYSQCRPDLTHDLLYYKKKDSTCSGGVETPLPVFDLPCNITCGVGEYLPLGSLNCSACQPGSFTRGGGRLVDKWNTWSTQLGIFNTYCVNNLVAGSPPINCSGWVLSGSYVRSGIITEVQSSILSLQTQLLIAGVVRFSYRVDAEPNYDGLKFYIDGNLVLPLVSVTTYYKNFAANLTGGYHTLTWEYYKDRSLDKGLDAAFIQSLEISGLTYAESQCTQCALGSYAPHPSSLQCTPCAFNYFANQTGSAVCSPCPDGQFAYVSASECTQKIPCTASDYQNLYGECTAGSRSITPTWLTPFICDPSSFPLPDPSSTTCAPCPAGTARDTNYKCVPCPTGSYSSQIDSTCQSCALGNAAAKVLSITSFDSWLPEQTTSCAGECGTDGWRLRSDFIDSGVGHGTTVSSTLTWNVTLEQAGFATFSFVLNCSRFCSLTFVDSPFEASVVWNTTSVGKNVRTTYTTPVALEVGQHEFIWIFSQNPDDPTPNNRTNAARIYEIRVNGTVNGGATTCKSCSNGTYTSSEASFCTNCTAGQSSDVAHTTCATCAGNSFSPRPGDNCYDCGPTTLVNPAHTDCTDTCSFTLNGDLYDISAIASLGPFGPVKYGEYSYFINLCGRGNFTDACVDEDDNPLITHVCQVLPYGYSLDVGWRTGYYSIPVTATTPKGFRVHYDMGLMGCGPRNNGVPYPRNSDLTFVCDPSAGLGTLQGSGVVENPPCHYNFVWRSLYACPICTEAHYSYYYTTCDSTGKRQQVYYWNDPVLCHDGVKLPASVQVDCSDSVFACGIGQRIGDDGESCVPCPVGEYSVGGGLLIASWPTGSVPLPYEYESSCDTFPCTQWSSDDGITIHSGIGDSNLFGTHSLRTTGSISFLFKLYSPTDGIFRFYIDGLLRLEHANNFSYFEWQNFTYPLNVGSHTFQWEFINGLRYSPSLLTFQGVTIDNIFVQGLDFHAETCLPCPDGTYSTNDTSVIGCVPCPVNTYTTIQTDTCSACPATQYSLVGASYCQNKTTCRNSNYRPIYTECGLTGTRNVTYTKILPDTCTGGANAPLPVLNVPCAPCPPYTFRSQGGPCIGCPAGQYFRDDGCVDNTAGYIVQHTQVYFGDNSLSTWPSQFFTGCSGVCGSAGWRISGAGIDSGFHGSNAVDSYVGINTNFIVDGSVTFTYVSASSTSNGLQFSIDAAVNAIQVPVNVTSPVTVTIPVPKGIHVLLWNYHQEVGGAGMATVSGISLLGVEGAIGASVGVACPPGQFSDDPTAVNCSICPPGTYSGVSASVACSKCAKNTYNPYFGADECTICEEGSLANQPGSTQCATECIFQTSTGIYDLRSLATVTVYDDYRRKYMINVCNNVGGLCPNSHSCIISIENTVTEAGNSFRFEAYNSTAVPFSIYFEHGDECVGVDAKRATAIQFQCDPDSLNASPSFVDEDDECLADFTWKSIYACPKCSDEDYTIVRGVCSGGKRQISKTRVTYCNGPASIDVPSESCDSREFPLGAILAVVFVFIAVVAVAAFIFFRNRRLTAQYATLMEETRSSNVSL